MLVQLVAAGRNGKRRDPQARLHAACVDVGHQRLHVVAAAREFGEVGRPVAGLDLPAVVQHGPLEAQFLHLGQRGAHIVEREIAFVAPRAPLRIVGALRRLGGRQALRGHQAAVAVERYIEVATVHGDERGRGGQRGAWRQRLRDVAAQGDLDPVADRLHGQRHEQRLQGQVADGQADVAAPDIGDRRAAAVVRRVHAHEVALLETALDGLDPVAPVGVAGAGIGPVAARMARRGGQAVRAVGPGVDRQRLVARIHVLHVEQCHARMLVEQGHGNALFDAPGGAADEVQRLSGAKRRRGPGRRGLLQREAAERLAADDQVFARVKARQRDRLLAQQADDTATQLPVELQRDGAVLHAHVALAGDRGGRCLGQRDVRGQRRRAQPPEECTARGHGWPFQAPGKARSAFVR